MILRFSLLLDVPTHFSVPVDQTQWPVQTHLKTKQGWTPARARASYETWGRGLVPITQESIALEKWYGIYIFAAEVPQPTVYVGIASNDSQSSEGALTRLKKHRVKATGSHVGSSASSIGSVHHPENWRDFAIKRFVARGGPDDALNDARIFVARFEGTEIQRKSDLERFESAIVGNQRGVLDAIVNKLWPEKNVTHVHLLNGATRRLELGPEDQILLA